MAGNKPVALTPATGEDWDGAGPGPRAVQANGDVTYNPELHSMAEVLYSCEYGLLARYRDAVRIASDDVAAANELAWCLAAPPVKTVRNGSEAGHVAERVVERSGRINWLETLAAAHAEAGDFPRVVIVQQEARDRLLPRLPSEAASRDHLFRCLHSSIRR